MRKARVPFGVGIDPLQYHQLKGQIKQIIKRNWSKVRPTLTLTNPEHAAYLKQVSTYLSTATKKMVENTRGLLRTKRITESTADRRLDFCEELYEVVSKINDVLARVELAGIPRGSEHSVNRRYRDELLRLLANFTYVPSVGFGYEKDDDGNIVEGASGRPVPLTVNVNGQNLSYADAFDAYRRRLQQVLNPVFQLLGPVGRFRGTSSPVQFEAIGKALEEAETEIRKIVQEPALLEIVTDSIVSRYAELVSRRQVFEPSGRISEEMLREHFRYEDPRTGEEYSYEETLELREHWKAALSEVSSTETRSLRSLESMLLRQMATALDRTFLQRVIDEYPSQAAGTIASKVLELQQRTSKKLSIREEEVTVEPEKVKTLSKEDIDKLDSSKYQVICTNHEPPKQLSWGSTICPYCGEKDALHIKARDGNNLIGRVATAATKGPQRTLHERERDFRVAAVRHLDTAILNRDRAQQLMLQIKVLDELIEKSSVELGIERARELEVRKWLTNKLFTPLRDLSSRLQIANENVKEGSQVLEELDALFAKVGGI